MAGDARSFCGLPACDRFVWRGLVCNVGTVVVHAAAFDRIGNPCGPAAARVCLGNPAIRSIARAGIYRVYCFVLFRGHGR